MTTIFEIKRAYEIKINERRLINIIKEDMDDFCPPDSEIYDNLETWALDLMALGDAFDEIKFIEVNNSLYSYGEIFDNFECSVSDYINDILVNFIVKWVRENWS